MATLYEKYIINEDNQVGSAGDGWRNAQTFTPAIAHTITSVKLKLYRSGSPGVGSIAITAVDGSGHPTGDNLASGAFDWDTLTLDVGGEWYEISFGAGVNLDASTKYAIILRTPNSEEGVSGVAWRVDASSPTYAGGNVEQSYGDEESWGAADYDAMFEDWGEPIAPPSPNLTSRNNFNGYLAFIQQYIKHKVNGTTPWKNPQGDLIE